MSSTIVFLPAVSIALLLESLAEMRLAMKEINSLKTAAGVEKVDGVVELPNGEKVGVRVGEGKPLEMVVPHEVGVETRAMVGKISQGCSRLKVLNETKRMGYEKVREEKLKNGSIRIVVQRWQ